MDERLDSASPDDRALGVQSFDTHHGLSVTLRVLLAQLPLSPRRLMMKFYNEQRQFYCGVDLHATPMYVCIIDHLGKSLLHKNFQCKDTKGFLDALAPYRQNLVVACESTFNWYWLADLMQENKIEFLPGHADRSLHRTDQTTRTRTHSLSETTSIPIVLSTHDHPWSWFYD